MWTRQIDLKRESVDIHTGEFEAVVFTDGEATDGHILNVRGASLPSSMPLFINHEADPRTQLGSLEGLQARDHSITARGKILLEGTGAQAEVRRDLLLKMARGHVSRMSGRWAAEPEHIKRRSELPVDHPAAVRKNSPSAARHGLYFEQWAPMEGSIVGLGADKAAMVRFARDENATPAVRAFWNSEVKRLDASRPDPGTFDDKDSFMDACIPEVQEHGTAESPEQAVAICNSMWENRTTSNATVEPPTNESRLSAFRAYLRELHRDGVTPDSLALTLKDELGADDFSAIEDEESQPIEIFEDGLSLKLDAVLKRLDGLEEGLAALRAAESTEEASPDEQGRDEEPGEAPPPEPRDVARELRREFAKALEEIRTEIQQQQQPEPETFGPMEFVKTLHDELSTARAQIRAETRAAIERARGRVSNG